MHRFIISFTVVVVLLSTSACIYQYLSADELKGVTLPSNNNVYKLAIKVKAKATCPSTIRLNTNFGDYTLHVSNDVDTILMQDWYGEPLEFSADYDSCLVKTPRIGIRFIDGY